jgi:hypothetical protein
MTLVEKLLQRADAFEAEQDNVSAVMFRDAAQLVREREMFGEKATFASCKLGQHFICWPLPGDNSGHGGYLGEQRLFVKTSETTAVNGRLVESSMNGTMDVIKVTLG